jgi:hypothetical protein
LQFLARAAMIRGLLSHAIQPTTILLSPKAAIWSMSLQDAEQLLTPAMRMDDFQGLVMISD